MKHKSISDIKKRSQLGKVRKLASRTVNLNKSNIISIPLKKIAINSIISLAVFSFILGSAYAPINNGYLLAATSKEEERAQLEAQLSQLEKQIAEYESTVSVYQKQGKSLESEIKTLNAKISKL